MHGGFREVIAEHKWPIISHKVEWTPNILKSKAEAKLSTEAYEKKMARTARRVYE